jgi:hypothetical protein
VTTLDGNFHIAERPVDPIGQPSNSGATWVNTSIQYDVAIAGIPFFLAVSKEHPYTRETAQYRKQQIDQQKEPGEQTLTGWWLRSQSSFHYGAGIRYEEPVEGDTVSYRFNKSAGVDVFNIGRVTLLPDVTANSSVTVGSGVSPILVGGTDTNGVDLYLTAVGSTLTRTTAAGVTTTLTWGGTGTIISVAQDGANYYVLNATGIYKGPLTGATNGTLLFTNPTMVGTVTSGVLGWVKQRLIAGINNYVFEVDPVVSYSVTSKMVDGSYNATLTTSSAHNFVVGDEITVASVDSTFNGTQTITAVANSTSLTYFLNTAAVAYQTTSAGTVALASNNNLPIYANPNPAWQWTAICEGPNNIYISGNAGTYSSIFRLALDTTTGQIPLLIRSLEAAIMPAGEQIYTLGAYLGKYIVIGSNKGIRIGTIDTSGFVSNGYITYGPLIVITNGYDPASATVLNGLPCRSLVFNDRYAYVTCSDYIDNGDGTYSSGLIKIDLSRDFGTLQMGWATHLRVPSTAEATSVCVMGQTNQLVIGVKGTGIYQQANTLVSSGYIQTGQIRYFTLEDKHFELAKLRVTSPLQGKLKLTVVNADSTTADIITVDNSFDFTQDITGMDTQDIEPKESIALRFTLYSATGQLVGQEDSFNGYQLKALPAVKRERMLTLPLENFDFNGDRFNMSEGYDGRAAEYLATLEEIESEGDVIILQDFINNESVRGVIDSIKFIGQTPPERRFNNFGGIIEVQFRTV